MDKMQMIVVSGEHIGQIVEVTGIFWFCETVTAKLKDGTECSFKFDEVEKIS